MAEKVWVFIDQFKGEAHASAWEVVGAGKELAGKLGGGVTAVVAGSGVKSVAEEAFHFGVDEVFMADDEIGRAHV